MTEPVSTWWQSPDRNVSVEFADGELVHVRVESGLIDPARSDELETALAEALNAGLERHTQDHLERLRGDADDDHALVAARARAAAAKHQSRRSTDPPDLPRPESGVSIAWRHGSVAAVRVCYRLLADGRVAPLEVAVAHAVNTPGPVDDLDLTLVDRLDPDEVTRDLQRVADDIRKETR